VGTLTSSISQWSNLRALILKENPGLTGTVASTIGKLSDLEILSIGDCSFNGPLPSEIGAWSNLREFWVYGNNFSSLPSTVGAWTNLIVFRIDVSALVAEL